MSRGTGSSKRDPPLNGKAAAAENCVRGFDHGAAYKTTLAQGQAALPQIGVSNGCQNIVQNQAASRDNASPNRSSVADQTKAEEKFAI